MPKRPKARDFTLDPKRKRSRAELRSRAYSYPLAACERCGESTNLKQIETKRGPETICLVCRIAHIKQKAHPEKTSPESRLDFAD